MPWFCLGFNHPSFVMQDFYHPQQVTWFWDDKQDGCWQFLDLSIDFGMIKPNNSPIDKIPRVKRTSQMPNFRSQSDRSVPNCSAFASWARRCCGPWPEICVDLYAAEGYTVYVYIYICSSKEMYMYIYLCIYIYTLYELFYLYIGFTHHSICISLYTKIIENGWLL